MAEWLFEIFSEEVPARMQRGAETQLQQLADQALHEAGLSYTALKTYVTPRRLTLVVEGLPTETAPKVEEKKGPRTDAPKAAIEGFLKSTGRTLEDCEIRETPKGQFYFATTSLPGRPTLEILSEISKRLLTQFRWPKSMRWEREEITWVRPFRGFLNLFQGTVVPFTYGGITASNQTWGHRFMAPGPFSVKDFKDYEKKLREHYVILDPQERRQRIQKALITLSPDLIPLEDEDLLDEVTGLVEWPHAFKGKVDPEFMELPLEVITTPMRVHQRYFPLFDKSGKLAPYFGVLANLDAKDKGATLLKGNERVLRARLADAKFFWTQDLEEPLEAFNQALKKRLFHQQLGSLFDKVERLQKIASLFGQELGLNSKSAERAARLSKADLASQMVNEFPEVQGIMGRYYALRQGETPEVAAAIEEQYWPIGAGGRLPEALPSLILGMADRLDTLMGFFAIGITPTGSKDPYSLRRAGLSLIALSLKAPFRISMKEALSWAYDTYPWGTLATEKLKSKEETLSTLWDFLLERFKYFLRDGQGSSYDHVDAVLSVAETVPVFSDLALRVKALDQLMDGADGQNLLTAYKRASNILRIEGEKDKVSYQGTVEESLLVDQDEKQLWGTLFDKSPQIKGHIEARDFVKAVQNLATLRPIVDRFFEGVIVNAEDSKIRKNRLHLLAALRNTMHQVADFSKIEG